MSARDTILAAVRAARLSGADRPAVDLPNVVDEVSRFRNAPGDPVARFVMAARETAVDVVECTRADVPSWLQRRFAGARKVVSTCNDVPSTATNHVSPVSFDDTDLFVCEAAFGVAENGAVWLSGSRLGERAAFFLATDILVLLSRQAIVDDVHAAYARIDLSRETFGIFVAGPSKTADIEQSLVIGAHGPKGMTLALVD
jgi:L-lactate dehydrogenase complex protein LldG